MFLEVYALVGPSGTGKSHRANIVAHNIVADAVIDDGLLIKDNRIIAGISSKCQPTRIGAIKTALFMDDQHAKSVKEAILSLNASKILILGTSDNMVEKIAIRLGLPPVDKILRIGDVASVKEIRKARMMRSQYSRHVVPAPTVEVRKTISETIIDPLQVFLRRKGKTGSKDWLEQSVVRPTFTYYGKLSISQSALMYIAKISAEQIKGVEAVKGIHLHRDEDGITLGLELVLFMGSRLDIVSRDIQEAVKRQMENMTSLIVKAVNISVISIHEFKKAMGKN